MEYTLERFQRAVNAFFQSPEPHSELERLVSHIEGEPYYDLRHRDDRKYSTLGQAWIDNDITETYDPTEDSPHVTRKRRSERRDQSSRRPRKRYRSLSPDSLKNKIEEQEKRKRETEERRQVEEDLFLSSSPFDYNLRARKKPNDTSVKAVETVRMDYEIHTEEPNLHDTSHAHGSCIACQELEIKCSLVEDPFYYPCQDCRQDNLECKLDPPPLWKRACEGCKKHRQPCSYSSGDYNHSQPCHFCIQHGFDCIAGPSKRQPPCASRQTPRSNLEVATQPPKCSDKRTLTMVDGSEDDDLTDGSSKPSSPPELEEFSQIPPESDVMPMESDAGSDVTLQSKISVITGSFATSFTSLSQTSEPGSSSPGGPTFQPPNGHPHSLTVWHEIPIDGSEPCNWCYNFSYGIVGYNPLRPRLTKVFRSPHTGQKYTYTHEKKPSRMCINCTMDRVAILDCAHNKIEPMPGLPLNKLEVCAAFEELTEASACLAAGSTLAGEPFPSPGYPWCSLCREPASYQCAVPYTDTSDMMSFEQYIAAVRRCGLRLCDYCAHYAKLYRGDLDAVVKRGEDDPNNKAEFRADVAFILKRSPDNEFKHLAGVE